jgi:hypothetical protein
MFEVADHVATLSRGLDVLHVTACEDRPARVDEIREVGVVEAVLGALVAAEVALADERARVARARVQVVLPKGDARVHRSPIVGAEGHRERRPLGLQAGGRGRSEERAGLGHAAVLREWFEVVVGQARGAEVPFHVVVLPLQVAGLDRPRREIVRRTGVERLGRLAQQHVGVDERPAAQSAGHQRPHLREAPQLEEAVEPPVRIPEGPTHLPGRPRERAGRVRHTPLEEKDVEVAAVGEAVGGHGATETRPDDDRVIVPSVRARHGQLPSRPL